MNIVQPIRQKDKIEEIKDLLRHQSIRDEFLFTLGINSGLRISDLLPLRVVDVKDKSHITIKEKKTGKEKRFKINSNLRTVIDEYIRRMDDEEFLFASRKTGCQYEENKHIRFSIPLQKRLDLMKLVVIRCGSLLDSIFTKRRRM